MPCGPVCEGVSGLGETGIGPEPVPDLGEVGTEPPPVFEDSLGDPFDNLDQVADIDKDEGSDPPIVIVQTKPIQIPQTGEGQRRKRFKIPTGQIDLSFVHKFRFLQSKSSSSPSSLAEKTKKTSTKSSRKSSRLTS